jgi:hypothetical protein
MVDGLGSKSPTQDSSVTSASEWPRVIRILSICLVRVDIFVAGTHSMGFVFFTESFGRRLKGYNNFSFYSPSDYKEQHPLDGLWLMVVIQHDQLST